MTCSDLGQYTVWAPTEDGSRRETTRFSLNAEVQLLILGGGFGTTLNASAGGLRVAVNRMLRAGDNISLRLRFLSGDTTTKRVRVVWVKAASDGCVAGLSFTEDVDPMPNTHRRPRRSYRH